MLEQLLNTPMSRSLDNRDRLYKNTSEGHSTQCGTLDALSVVFPSDLSEGGLLIDKKTQRNIIRSI